ncbi:hypothetical protein FHR48_003854 [Xanthomonas arboricola]|nr:hypothetical protein [Xanthomonas cannabis]NIK66267.1 hypothetical protein [Xanthomonas cannabis]
MPREQIQTIHIECVQAVATDAERATGDGETIQAVIASKVRRTGGERNARGIEEPAAITGNAVRVGDHQLRLGACDFGVPLQPAARRCDLVEDQRSSTAALQIVVAGNVTAQLGL